MAGLKAVGNQRLGQSGTAGRAPVPRRRAWYGVAIAAVIGTGLLWRSGWFPLPHGLAKYGGDALWAVVVFLGLGFVLPRASTRRIALGALGIAWSVECLQLYHAPWIDGVRATRLGHLVLGRVFNSPDLLAYAAGIVLAAWAEGAMGSRTTKRVPCPGALSS